MSQMANLPKNYVRRSGWDAADPQSKPTIILASRVDTVFFHYTASNADEQADHRNCPPRVRGIQRYHMSPGWSGTENGGNDIAYSFLVCKHGYIFEGRGMENMSAATFGHNSHSLAVCFLGDDTLMRDDVTPAGRQALVEITRWIVQRRPAVRYFKGHRDVVRTTCPGQELYDYVTGRVFPAQVALDEKARLRKQILAWRAGGWGWEAIKATRTWERFRALGGR